MILKMKHLKISNTENNTTNSVQSKKVKLTNMKKYLIITTAALITAGLICFFTKQSTTETAVNKDINLEVYKTASYVSPVYENSFATLKVTVIRIKGSKKDTAFQYTFEPKQLKDFPGSDKPMVQKITIPNVNDSKERLEIFYNLTYDTKGSVLNFLNTATIEKGQQTGKLNIQI